MIRPFIKWAGGKTRVLPDLLPHLPKADCLIEPFVGGASVFLATEYRRYVLADINPDLINLYREVTRYPDLVIDAARELFNSKNSPQGYNEVRAAFNKQVGTVKSGGLRYGAEMACIMRAAQFLYLNRHGYNGLCRYSRKTGFNVPFGKYKSSVYFPENEIRLFAEKANDTKAIFLCAPFQRSLQVVTGGDVLVYCDPPYLPESKTADFTQYHTEPFTEDNHRQLVQALLEVNRKHGVKVVISNSDTEATRAIYQPFKMHEISVQRSVSTDKDNRQKAKEVIGVLPVCDCCGRYGGGCPDCGAVMGDATYNAMVAAGTFDDLEAF
ncbi:Dam family site-specific DNA-(adenine-N6)-methyltransferase [Citrobacter telavivensis]|uniref:Site-specific DNA-methyltransferase (adenine-specific) n=1 Tax=Citrobacter telavivensis TaxID=2653932 RepID=A0A6L5EBS0_9ENTR|nr:MULTISPECIES: Dam family site-specific DNA-(adenine-N6)-methyltransferase [Citrobacter]MCS1421880.1 Dam family site-specific DNA-(adenine-N6)-methyltransferase [Citrobacter portucalensis]MPQ52914.1 Dam family site-specific DNA-(adenine-N6)-methyltransferase [Citrobacter telavivensis]QFS69708.1 Dam family site-specific DNA-(adenine-N6)-methyltransferase [Citrobacter telavivensis]